MMKLKKILLTLLLLTLTACSKKNSSSEEQAFITVASQPNITTLNFTSAIQPLKVIAVTAPYDGIVTEKFFQNGDAVKQDQALINVQSSQLENDYQTAFAEYLKEKKNYTNDLIEIRNTEQLEKLQIISRDEYISAKSNSYDTALSYQQAIYKLQDILNKGTVHPLNLKMLQNVDVQQISKMLPNHMNIYSLVAPATGIVLLPANKGNDSNSDNQNNLSVGGQIKGNQELLDIGDMSGASFTIKVDEVHINQIKLGQNAIITGDAFPAMQLQGVVTQVEQQAVNSDRTAIPEFPVKITVKQLTPEQQKILHVGMSAKVALKIEASADLQLPLAAVKEDQGQAYVKKLDPASGKIIKTAVQTGATTLNDVVITSGLQTGDKILTNYGVD